MKFTVYAPDIALTSNQRLHHMRKAEITRNWRLRTALWARFFDRMPHAHVTYWVHATTNRRRDAANYYPTVKACLDGIVDAGVLPDDSDKYVVGPDPRSGDNRPEFALTIQLEPDCVCPDCAARFTNGDAA